MTIEQRVKGFLTDYPAARERKVRAKVVWALLGLGETSMNKEVFVNYYTDILSVTRMIIRVQQLNISLRGSDYSDKVKLEQEKKIELGYEPGYHQDIKKLKTLT